MSLRRIFVICFLLICVIPLFAYIDPGAGSYIIQIIIAGSLTIAFLLKTQWRRLVALFKRMRGKVDREDGQEEK